jgi:hypothetical protein
MTPQRRSIFVAAVLLGGVAAAAACIAGPLEVKDSGEATFTGKAIFVQTREPSRQNLLLEEPQVKELGNRSFLVGRVVQGETRFWLPLADVARIEEFASVEELGKHYQLGRPAEKRP